MRKISCTREATVPDGVHCVDYYEKSRVEKCEQLRTEVITTTWQDGLGSPGSISHYSCALFDKGLHSYYPHEGFHGLTVKKCAQCLDASF